MIFVIFAVIFAKSKSRKLYVTSYKEKGTQCTDILRHKSRRIRGNNTISWSSFRATHKAFPENVTRSDSSDIYWIGSIERRKDPNFLQDVFKCFWKRRKLLPKFLCLLPTSACASDECFFEVFAVTYWGWSGASWTSACKYERYEHSEISETDANKFSVYRFSGICRT